MTIHIRLFAILRERAGLDATTTSWVDGMTVLDTLQKLVRDGVLEDDIPFDSFMCAVNHEYAALETLLSDGDELALIPPVSGG